MTTRQEQDAATENTAAKGNINEDSVLDTERAVRPNYLLILAGLFIALGIVGLDPASGFNARALTTALVVGVLLIIVISLIPRKRPGKKTGEYDREDVLDLSTFGAVPVAAKPAAQKEEPAEAKAEAPKEMPFKPVKFDKAIAATGVTIAFGTESGNCETLATMAADDLKKDGFAVQVVDNEVIDARHLPAFANLLMIVSTWGEGDPPSNSVDLMAQLKSDMTLDLSGSQFSVLAMGDTNYEHFCKCGKDFDELLEKYGAERFYKRVDCDLDYETPYAEWLAGAKDALKSGGLKSKPEYAPPAEAEKEAATV